MMRANPRVGLIGVGAISEWHVRALRAAGLEVAGVAARRGSTRLADFATRCAIPEIFPDWRTLLAASGRWDALMIATDPYGTPEVLEQALACDVPILVEKPVARTSRQLEPLCAVAHPRVIVGFNRRFYRPVQAAREEVRQGPPLFAHLSLPEKGPSASHDWLLTPFFENSSHGIDLLRFVFGDVRVEAVQRLMDPDGRLLGLDAALTSPRGDRIQLASHWGASDNFALTLDRPGRRFDLRPFELATIYDGMEILPASAEVVVKRYVPRVAQRIGLDEVDVREKPGFVRQAQALRALVENRTPVPEAATLQDALAAIRLCEALIGEEHPVHPRGEVAVQAAGEQAQVAQ